MAPRSLVLKHPRQLGALVSPVRVEIVEALQASGPQPIRALAAQIGRTPHSLYHHFRCLQAAGLVAVRETRRRGRRDEAVYALAAERLVVPERARSAAHVDALTRSTSALLRRAERNFRRAVETGEHRVARSAIGAMAGSRRARLDDATLRRVSALVARIDALLAKGGAKPRGRLFLWTFVLSPIPKP